MKQPIFIFFYVSILFFGKTKAQKTTGTDNSLKENVDMLVNTSVEVFMNNPSRIGLSVGVFRNGKIAVYHYGTTQKGKNSRPTNNTVYEIGSITKTFTGILLAQAVVDKKVKINDDVRKYLEGDYPNLSYKGQGIELFQLINHTSGLPFLLPDRKDIFQHSQDSISYFVTTIQSQYNKSKFLRDLHYVKLDTVPGVMFSYSNAGAQLLSFVLEKVYGMSYEKLVKKYITIPEKMPGTKLTYTKNEMTRFAWGYNGKGMLMPYNPAMIGAAGKINSTIPDMLKYIKLNLNENNPVVKLSHATTFGDINNFAIGLNWQMNKTSDGHRRIWQSGGSFGFASYCVVYPELNTGIVLLSNEADQTAQSGLEEVAKKIFEGLQVGSSQN